MTELGFKKFEHPLTLDFIKIVSESVFENRVYAEIVPSDVKLVFAPLADLAHLENYYSPSGAALAKSRW